MLKNFISNIALKFKMSPPLERWFRHESEAEHWRMPDPSIYANQARLYNQSIPLRTVIDAVVNSCVETDIDIIDENDKEDDAHPFMKLLESPNEFDSRSEFLEATYKWYEITRNCYWWLNRPSANVPPSEIWILPTSKIIPVPDGRMGLRGYAYYPGNGLEIPLEPYEVVHFKNSNPFSRYVGLSPIETLAMVLQGGVKADEWNTRLFADNNARLPGIIAFAEEINNSDWDRLKREVDDQAKKRNNMMLRGAGKGGVEWIQGASTQREMEFIEGIEANTKRTYDFIAPGFYNMITSNSSLANGQTGLYVYQKFTIAPILRMVEDKINKEIMPSYGDGKRLIFDDVIPDDKEFELRELEAFAKYHTVDEVRLEKFGNSPDPDTERGKLFVAQINSQTGKPEPKQPQAVSEEVSEELEEMQPEQPSEKEQPDEVKADLARWRRKAIKAGKAVEFTSDCIPADIHTQITNGLSAAKNVGEIVRVFDSVKPVDSVRALAYAIEKAVNEIKSTV